MSARGIKKYGPQVYQYLEAGERLLDVQFIVAIKSVPRTAAQPGAEPIIGTGATAGRLVNEMPARSSGVVCITDLRVFFCSTGFSKVKRMWWETTREDVAGVMPGRRRTLFALQFADGSQVWFAGSRPDRDSIAHALSQGYTGNR